MRVVAVGQAETGGGLMQKAEVYGEDEKTAAEGGIGCESDGSGFVGAERLGAAVVRDAVKGGACETGRTSRYRALRGRNGVRGLSVAVSGGFAAADGGERAASVAPAAVVCDAQCYRRSSLHCLVHHVCLLQHQHRSWKSEKGSAPACPVRRQLSFV